MESQHISVLLHEILELAHLPPSASVLDVTLGLGGHAEAILRASPDATIVGLDADSENLQAASERLKIFGDRVHYIHSNFSEIPECLPASRRSYDFILADLGLSSPHLDTPERGFSWRADAPLDMRFDRSSGKTAALVLGSYDLSRLTQLFQSFGELQQARTFAKTIIASRKSTSIETTLQLKAIAELVYGYRAPKLLPQIFQALRMEVNNELRSLVRLLDIAPTLLRNDGILAVISFHSLEDRMVKHAFRSLSTPEKDPVTGATSVPAPFILLTKRPLCPSAKEVASNPRSRSANLRALKKVGEYSSRRNAAC